jgi:hypothetical protein
VLLTQCLRGFPASVERWTRISQVLEFLTSFNLLSCTNWVDMCLRRAAVIHIVQGDQLVAASERIVKGCDANREPKPYRFLSFGLNEMPSRIAIFLTDSGFRPVAFTASSNDFEARASSIKRRCSANDQIDFRTMQE